MKHRVYLLLMCVVSVILGEDKTYYFSDKMPLSLPQIKKLLSSNSSHFSHCTML